MALSLTASFSQSNDATFITITDTTGAYSITNTGGWTTPNETYADIVTELDETAINHHLLVQVSVKDKSGADTDYTAINLYDTNDLVTARPFASLTDLTWKLTPANLIASGTAMGTSTDQLTDGIYTVTYFLTEADDDSSILATVEYEFLLDGSVRGVVYDALREVSRQYDDEINNESKEIMDTLLDYTYLLGMNASSTEGQQANLVNQLWTLNKMTSDGSKYTW